MNEYPRPPQNPHFIPPRRESGIRKALIISIALILISVIGFYFFFPILGIALVISAGAWGLVIATIAAFTIAVLLFFIIPGILVFLISSFAFVWVILAIILFPILFPIIIPIFILLLFLAYFRNRKNP